MPSKIRLFGARLALALGLLLPALSAPALLRAADSPPPKTVTLPGTLQSKLGCPGDWQPNCAKTYLTYDPLADVWGGAPWALRWNQWVSVAQAGLYTVTVIADDGVGLSIAGVSVI